MIALYVFCNPSSNGCMQSLNIRYETWIIFLKAIQCTTYMHTFQPFCILRNLSASKPRIPHSSQNITEWQILQIISQDFHQMDVKSLIQGPLSRSKDDLWAVILYSLASGAYPSGTERKRLRREADRWIELGRGGGLWKLVRDNTKNIPECHSSSRSVWLRIQLTKCWQVCICIVDRN